MMRLGMQAYGAHALLSMFTAELPVNHPAEHRHEENRSSGHNGGETILSSGTQYKGKESSSNEWMKLVSPSSKL